MLGVSLPRRHRVRVLRGLTEIRKGTVGDASVADGHGSVAPGGVCWRRERCWRPLRRGEGYFMLVWCAARVPHRCRRTGARTTPLPSHLLPRAAPPLLLRLRPVLHGRDLRQGPRRGARYSFDPFYMAEISAKAHDVGPKGLSRREASCLRCERHGRLWRRGGGPCATGTVTTPGHREGLSVTRASLTPLSGMVKPV